jgi:outer membrane protein assembly factor BamB
LTATASAHASQTASTEGWPYWLGPDGTGVSSSSGWSVEGAPLWSRAVGLGYSAVVIQDGRMFTMGFDEARAVDTLFCMNPLTGDILWTHIDSAEIRNNFHGGGTLTTPTIDGEHLFVTNRVGQTRCHRTDDGSLVWERDYTAELELKVIFHGFSACPLVVSDALVLGLGGTLIMVDKSDGTLIWKGVDHGEGSHASPVQIDIPGPDGERPCFASFSGKGMALIDATTGEDLSFLPWKASGGGVNAATPIVMGQRVFMTSAYGMGCALLDYSAVEPEIVWQNKRMRNKVSGCLLFDEHLFGFDESMLKCLDLEGNEIWRVRGLGMGALTIAGGRLIVLTSDGEMLIAPASPQGFEPLGRTQALESGVCWTAPLVLDGLIYCRNSLGQLVCLDHRKAPTDTGPVVENAKGVNPLISALPAAGDLFARHLEVIGGADALRARKSMHIEGTIEILGAGITRTAMTLDVQAPDRWHLRYDLGKYGAVQRGFDGKVGWQLDPFYGDELKAGDALHEAARAQRLQGAADFASIYTHMGTVGRATFDGRDCWTVKATHAQGGSRTLYFEADSGLLAGRDGQAESLVHFANYERFGDLLLATKMTVLIPETGAEETYRIDSVAFDETPSSTFDLPEAVLRMLRTPQEVEAANEAARERYSEYLGTYIANYDEMQDAEFSVLVHDGLIALQPPDRDPMPLADPGEDGKWFLVSTETVFVSFVRGEDDEILAMKLSVRGKENELPRRNDG